MYYDTLTLGDDVQTDPNVLADAVWDRLNSAHTGAGSMGAVLSSILSNSGDISSIASDVWDRLLISHTDAGSVGEKLGSLADFPIASDIADAVWDKSLNQGKASKLLEFLYDVEIGRWKIDTSTKELILYKGDNVTEIARFDLKGATGAPNATAPFERVKQ